MSLYTVHSTYCKRSAGASTKLITVIQGYVTFYPPGDTTQTLRDYSSRGCDVLRDLQNRSQLHTFLRPMLESRLQALLFPLKTLCANKPKIHMVRTGQLYVSTEPTRTNENRGKQYKTHGKYRTVANIQSKCQKNTLNKKDPPVVSKVYIFRPFTDLGTPQGSGK